MDDEELFDNDATTNAGHGGPMMSERDPSFLSSAAGSAPGGGGHTGYPGAASTIGAGMAGAGAGAYAASRSHNGGSEAGDYYSQDGHNNYSPERSPAGYPQQPYYGQAQPNYGNDGSMQHFAPQGYAAPAGAAGLGRSGSIASNANYQVEALSGYGGYPQDGSVQGGSTRSQQGRTDPSRNRNRLSVVNALGDVGEE